MKEGVILVQAGSRTKIQLKSLKPSATLSFKDLNWIFEQAKAWSKMTPIMGKIVNLIKFDEVALLNDDNFIDRI